MFITTQKHSYHCFITLVCPNFTRIVYKYDFEFSFFLISEVNDILFLFVWVFLCGTAHSEQVMNRCIHQVINSLNLMWNICTNNLHERVSDERRRRTRRCMKLIDRPAMFSDEDSFERDFFERFYSVVSFLCFIR